MMEKIKKNYIFLFCYLFAIICTLFITVGYSALSVKVTINGDLVYRAPAEIRITGITVKSNTSSSIAYSPTYKVSTISTGSILNTTSSNIVYEVTVVNKSNKYKTISSITTSKDSNTNISYTMSGFTLNQIIMPNSTIKLTLTYKYNGGITTLPSNTVDDTTIQFTFKDAKITAKDLSYNNSSSNLKSTDVQDALDELSKKLNS